MFVRIIFRLLYFLQADPASRPQPPTSLRLPLFPIWPYPASRPGFFFRECEGLVYTAESTNGTTPKKKGYCRACTGLTPLPPERFSRCPLFRQRGGGVLCPGLASGRK